MSTFEILCVTMNQKDFSKIQEMNIHSNVVFANQADRTSFEQIEFDGHTAKMITTATRGVGINRNLALMYSSADICLFADDDVVYYDGYEDTICRFYAQHPDADVVIFNFSVSRKGKDTKQIISKSKKLKRKKLSYGTYAISVRRSAVLWNNITFHHQFGGGAIYSCGEDSKFLNDCFEKKLTFYTCSDLIGIVNHQESTWFNGFTDKFFVDKGILFYATMKHLAVPASIYHVIKHKKEYGGSNSMKIIKLMIRGVKKAKKL